MIYFEVPFFSRLHREQLHAMCAAPPQFGEPKDDFSYLPIDPIYTTGNGLPSFVVRHASKTKTLLTIGSDSDVISTHWYLSVLLHDFIGQYKQKWLNQLIKSPLPILQHCLIDSTTIHPISGLNSLYLTLLCFNKDITDNIWRISPVRDNKDSVYLSSYIHKLSSTPNTDILQSCPHPFLFLNPNDEYQQHIYAGVNIVPHNKNYRTFCERLPFKPLGMQYTPSSWVSVLINKFSHFKPFKVATAVAAEHPDLFAALIVCSVGLPANLLFDHTNFCSLVDISKYELCEKLVQLSPLVDYCSTLMIDESQITSNFSYFIDQHNADIA